MCHGLINLILCLEGLCVWLHSLLFRKPVWRLFVSLLDFKCLCHSVLLFEKEGGKVL